MSQPVTRHHPADAWGRLPAACALLLLLLAAGCRSGGGAPDPATPTAGPTTTATASPTHTRPTDDPATATPTAGLDEVTAYYVRTSGDRLWVEPEQRRLGEPTLGVAAAAVSQVLEGSPDDPGLRTLAPEGTRLLGAVIEDGILTLDLSAEVRARPADGGEEAFAQQLAWTGAQFDTVDAIRLLVEGASAGDLWGEIEWSEPIAPDPFALSPIIVEEPERGATLPSGPVTVSGTANVFEATLGLRLLAPDGTVVEETFTTATCGTGCRGDFRHTFEARTDRPGTWMIVATEDDASGGEGPPPFSIEVPFTVR